MSVTVALSYHYVNLVTIKICHQGVALVPSHHKLGNYQCLFGNSHIKYANTHH